MYYESERDVELRLRHSLVMWEKRPVVVQAAESKDKVIVDDLLTGRSSSVRIEALNLAPDAAKLGYVIDDRGRVFFSMRKPVRKYKQGLTQDNFFAFNALEKPVERLFGQGRSEVSPFSKSVAKTIVGDFPDIGEAFQAVRSGASKIVPFHREWAVADKEDELLLMYRGDVVGYVGDQSVKLMPDRFYLQEVLAICLK